MKDAQLQIKVTSEWKERLKKGAQFLNINFSMFVIQAVNEKLERMGR